MSTILADPAVAARPGLLATDEARIDGREKVSGQAKYTADFTRAGMLWAAFVASPVAHARIKRIDCNVAREMPGVRAVLTGADIGERFFGCTLEDWPVLAYERVRFVGEYVAAVAAESVDAAEAAAAAIEVEYEELPPFLDPEAAIAPGAPLFHEDDSKFRFAGPKRPARPHPNMQGYDLVVKGDPDAAFAGAARVFEGIFHTPRYHAGYIEPRATLVWVDETDALHVLCTNKNPFRLREMLASTTGLPKEKVIVEPSFIGGEFGAKALTIEEFPLYYLALATKRPVKHVRSHSEDVRSTHVRHAAHVRVRIGMSADGTIQAVEIRALFDGGAYGAGKPGPSVLPGRAPKLPYNIPNARIERIAAYTNTIPGAFVRAPGEVQMIFGVESLMDIAAGELGIDPLELRLHNAARDGATDLEGNLFASPRPVPILERLKRELKWGTALPKGRGRGVAVTARHIAGGKTNIVVHVQPNGELTIDTGSTEPGVGTFTVLQRVLAADLGVDPTRIKVVRSATDTAPIDPGIGGSKGTLLLGRAALDAAKKIKLALERAEALHLPWEEAARVVTRDGPLKIDGVGEYVHKPGEPMWVNFGGYGVDLSVDPETGETTFHDVVFIADVGTVINPVAHRGQINGGFSMGFGHAFTEELRLDGGRIVNIALSDYKLPTQADMPPFRVVSLEPDGGPGPFGARAAGEFNISGVAPAIANAIASACGVRLDSLGLTAERIHAALH